MSSEDKFDGAKFRDDLRDRIHRDIHEGMNERSWRAGRRQGMFPGLVLVSVGTVILLDHMGIISFDRVWRYWPLILVIVGAVKFFKECERVVGALLMLGGVLFLLNQLGYTKLSWNELWPIALIVMGIALIWTRFELPKLPSASSGDGANVITASAVFGGVERRINTSSFRGGTVGAVFGGVELDFRSADIEGEEAVLYLDATFGGIEIVVPERWTVIYEGQSIFGGYTDETRPPLPDVPGAPPKKRLILRGRAMFGGINVKN